MKIRAWHRKAAARLAAEAVNEEVARYLEPDDIGSFKPQQAYTYQNEPNDDCIYDGEPQQMRDNCVSVLDTLITPSGKVWHRTVAPTDELNEDYETREYLQYVNETVYQAMYSKDAGVVAALQSTWRSIVNYGAGYMFTGANWTTGMPRFVSVPWGEGYPTFDKDRNLVGFDRYFRLTAWQAWKKFGDAIPTKIREELERSKKEGGSDREFAFIHAVSQREDYDAEAPDMRAMPWVSCVISVEGEAILREKGYYSMPYSVGQWRPETRTDYPRGAAGRLLPAIRTLNAMMKTVMLAGELATLPPVWVPDDSAFSINWEPGSIIYGGVSRDGKMRAHTMQQGDPRITVELMETQRNVIRNGFLNQWFQFLQQNPQMTAAEVYERMRTSSAHLAPPVGQLQRNFLAQLFDRVLDVCQQLGIIQRPMPPLLREKGGVYGLEFDSPITDAQRAEEGAGFVRTLNILSDYVTRTGDKSATYVVNAPRAFRGLFRGNATPEDWLSSDEEIATRKQADAEAAERDRTTKEAPAAASLLQAAAAADATAEEEAVLPA